MLLLLVICVYLNNSDNILILNDSIVNHKLFNIYLILVFYLLARFTLFTMSYMFIGAIVIYITTHNVCNLHVV